MPDKPKSSRIEFLRDQYLPRLTAQKVQLSAAWNGFDAEQIFAALHDADPTPKKQTLERLLNWTLKGDVAYSTLPETTDALSIFEQVKKTLPVGQNDVNRYKIRDDFMAAVMGVHMARIDAWLSKDRAHTTGVWASMPRFPAEEERQPDYIFKAILSFDPGRGRNLDHILRWLEHDQEPLLPEDLPRVYDDLTLYQKNQHDMLPQYRDIRTYKTVFDLQKAVAPYKKSTAFSVEELCKIEDREIAADRAALVAEGSTWRLIHVKTQEAAIALGQGTDWCTARLDPAHNFFKTYSESLLYFRTDKGNRYQFSQEKFQFMDVNDRIIKLRDIVGSDPVVHKILTPLFLYNKAYDYEEYITNMGLHEMDEADYLLIQGELPKVLKAAVAARPQMENGVFLHAMTLATTRDAWRDAVDPVIPEVLPKFLMIATDKNIGYSGWLTKKVLQNCQHDYEWAVTAADALPAALEKARRNEFGEMIKSVEEACDEFPFFRSKALDGPCGPSKMLRVYPIDLQIDMQTATVKSYSPSSIPHVRVLS